MKFTTTLLISILLVACNSKPITSFIPIDYSFPHDQIKSGKTFTYLDQNSGDTTYQDIYLKSFNNIKYLISKSYTKKGTLDSMIYKDYKLIETYSYILSNSKISKAEIVQDKIIENGKKLGKRILKVNYHTDSTILAIISESEFIKDTTFFWNGNKIKALVVKTTFNNSIKSKLKSGSHTDFKVELFSYEAQMIGTVRIALPGTQDRSAKIIDLVDIKDRQD